MSKNLSNEERESLLRNLQLLRSRYGGLSRVAEEFVSRNDGKTMTSRTIHSWIEKLKENKPDISEVTLRNMRFLIKTLSPESSETKPEYPEGSDTIIIEADLNFIRLMMRESTHDLTFREVYTSLCLLRRRKNSS